MTDASNSLDIDTLLTNRTDRAIYDRARTRFDQALTDIGDSSAPNYLTSAWELRTSPITQTALIVGMEAGRRHIHEYLMAWALGNERLIDTILDRTAQECWTVMYEFEPFDMSRFTQESNMYLAITMQCGAAATFDHWAEHLAPPTA